MHELIQIAYWIYNYCTDFVINLANIFNLSYYEINFLLFVILYPLLLIGTSLLYLLQQGRFLALKKPKERPKSGI
jgi:hypothetical protein